MIHYQTGDYVVTWMDKRKDTIESRAYSNRVDAFGSFAARVELHAYVKLERVARAEAGIAYVLRMVAFKNEEE